MEKEFSEKLFNILKSDNNNSINSDTKFIFRLSGSLKEYFGRKLITDNTRITLNIKNGAFEYILIDAVLYPFPANHRVLVLGHLIVNYPVLKSELESIFIEYVSYLARNLDYYILMFSKNEHTINENDWDSYFIFYNELSLLNNYIAIKKLK